MGHSVLASDVTSEAVVFRGCTTSEIIAIIIGSMVFWGPVCTFFALYFFDSLFAGVGMVMLATLFTLLIMCAYVTRLKRDMPSEHYQLRLEAFLSKHNIKKYHFFTYHGEMSIGRTQQIVFMRGDRYEK